jgi:hypothetical protein
MNIEPKIENGSLIEEEDDAELEMTSEFIVKDDPDIVQYNNGMIKILTASLIFITSRDFNIYLRQTFCFSYCMEIELQIENISIVMEKWKLRIKANQ